MNRKEFLQSALAAAVSPFAAAAPAAGTKSEYHAFSRALQFLKEPEKAAALLGECGYDGVEWTVRPRGFVDTDGARTALPALKRAKKAADAAGIKAESIVVGFTRGDEPGAQRLVMEASQAGFRSFRGGYFRYDRARSHRENTDSFRRGFDTLDALAAKSGLKCCYQHHSTYNKNVPLFGSLVWDLASILTAYDPKHIGVQYDPMHIRAEGGPSWDHTLGPVAPWVDMVCLKDFHFAPDETGRDWKRVLVPAGKGIVDFREVKRLMELESVPSRFSVHFDYVFPEDTEGARRFLSDDLAVYRSVFG